ncbi:UNVERIFIED_CONTAM: cytochrome [Sesamum latifolium]|uniref:Cytochrome n=1 Tax=Sesamum latifolium TaxID=2727402 RepID=A0AAW2SNB5_9LAMI
MLLASNPEWQTRIRNEVEEVCQGLIPDTDMLHALEFKPQGFENGIAGACKSPKAYMPFGFGQHLAMVELKLVMALILANFSFTLSPNYVHSPVAKMIIEPEHGVQIMVKML